MDTRMFLVFAFAMFSAAVSAQSKTGLLSAKEAIDAGNQAWIEGMKAGDIARIGATYAEDAVDCDPKGNCIEGRNRIERRIADQLARLGRARAAAVKSLGMTEHGVFVYEWGQAEAGFAHGKSLVEKYLTVWQRQPDGNWKIFRNLVLP